MHPMPTAEAEAPEGTPHGAPAPAPAPASAALGGGGRGLLVVVPARDAEATLPACLAAIAASTLQPAAVVLVDDGSTDGTAAIAEAAGALVLRPDAAPLGPGRARDLAVSRTAAGFGGNEARSADLVALIDADVAVHPDALGKLVAELRDDSGVVAAFGSYDDDPPAPAVASRYANLRHHFTHQNAGGEAVTFWAGLGVVRRAAWDAAGGFGDRYHRPAIEDIDLGRRLVAAGGRIRCVPAAQATHLKAWTLGQLWRTDVFQRALPWSRLLVNEPPVTPVEPPPHRRTERVSKLNTGRADQFSALAVHGFWFTLLLGLLVHPLLLLGPPLCLVAWVLLNRRFLGLLARRGGAKLLLGGGLLHATYHGYASVAFAWVLLESRWDGGGRPAGTGRSGPPFLKAATLATVSVLLAGGLTLLGGALVPTEAVASALASLGDGSGLVDDAAADAGGLQRRAAALGAFLLAAAAASAAAGPRVAGRAARGAARTLRGLAAPLGRRPRLAVLAVCTAVLGVRIVAGLDLPLRADEAQTFLRSGAASPLVTAAVWDSPNNHILHSLLMRASVGAFGTAPWAVRLPATIVTLAVTPLVFLGLRRHLGAAAALLAAAAWAGSGYAVEVGTSARGYPIVLGATLALAALARGVAAGRAGATALAAAAAALGAWAVPVMLLPFSALVAYVLLQPRVPPARRALRAAVLAAATGSLCLLLYAPALLLRAPRETGAGSAVRDAVAPLNLAERAAGLTHNARSALEQMAWPAGETMALVLAAAAGVGLLLGCTAGGRSRRFLLAAIAGPLLTLAALGLPPVPWWSLGFAFPVLLGCLALPPGRLLERLPRTRRRVALPLAALGLLGVMSAASAIADWKGGFPNRIGFADAPETAAVVLGLLDRPGAGPLRVAVGPGQGSSLAYHFHRAKPKPASPTKAVSDRCRETRMATPPRLRRGSGCWWSPAAASRCFRCGGRRTTPRRNPPAAGS